jgi:hypothetical protein
MVAVSETFPRPLTDRERAALNFILSREFAGSDALRAQAATVTAVGRCGCGCASINLGVDRSRAPRAEVHHRTPVVEARSRLADPPFELLLFVKEGWLQYLEIVWYGDEPINEYPSPDEFLPPSWPTRRDWRSGW